MVELKFSKILVYIIFLMNCIVFVSSAFPDFSFTSTSIPSGLADISGQASSGTQLELYANGNFVGRQDIIAQSKTILLNNTITNVDASIGSNIIFRNNDLLNSMTINISGNIIFLPVGGTHTFNAGYIAQDILYEHLESGDTAIISIDNELIDFTFSDVEQTYLIDGTNSIGFIQKYPLSNLSSQRSFNFSIFYDKFPNAILISNSTNITRQRQGTYRGRVSVPSHPLYYVINYEGPIINTGILNPISKSGSVFNITIDNLREGENIIRFISTDPTNSNIFTGEEIVRTTVDTINPTIDIIESYFVDREGYAVDVSFGGQTQYVNGLNLIINLTTDGKFFEIILNNQSEIVQVLNESVFIDAGLNEGVNTLIFIVEDEAGNIYKESHVIDVNTQGPQLLIEEMQPEEIFGGSKTAHFHFQNIEGKTDQGDVEITVFSFVRGSASFESRPPGYEEPQSCLDFKSSFVRNLGQLDRDRPRGPELNLDESQVSVSLQSFMFNRVETTSDSQGEFDVILGLQERDFNERDIYESQEEERTSSSEIGDVKSQNIVCFVLKDKFGNVEILDFPVTLDAGNTLWKPGEITTLPNTLYSAEIENSGDVRSGNGNIRFAMIARFNYIGPGEVNTISSVRIVDDRTTYSRYDEDQARTRIIQSEMNFRYDKQTGEMLVYVPVEILPLGIPPQEYPDNFDLGFAAYLTYTVDDTDIPIDTRNPIYFRTKLNIERPLDHTKWLSPKMLEDSLRFLNKSIYYTEKAIKYTGFAAVGGVLACTGAKFWHAAEITQALALSDKDAQKEAIEEADRKLYQICDRVACTASPRECNLANADDEGYVNVPEGSNFNSVTNEDSWNENLYFEQDGLRTGELDNTRFTGSCDFNGDGIDGDGVLISGDAYLYKDTLPITGGSTVIKEKRIVRGECIPAQGIFVKGDKKLSYEEYAKLTPQERLGYESQLEKVNLQGAGNVCFNENPPHYDNHRCNFFNPENPFAGIDPATSIISSVQCACVTDTYSHLKVAHRVMEGMEKCLQQAKIGYVKGSYCERLMSQAVCDIATNVVLPEIQQNINARKGAGDAGDTRGGLDFLANMKKSENSFNQRYSGTILSQAGLSTNQILNKACLGAITGDWSVLTDNILNSVDQNEVEPVFGPPFPESRQMGYNPITGEMSIQYRFTHGVVSGGQVILTKAELICDSSAPYGNYCPESQIIVSSDMVGRGFRFKNLPPVLDGSAVQDTIVITEAPARFWYNKLRLTYSYSLKGEQQTNVKEFTILHKQETLLGSCYWNAGTFGTNIPSESTHGGEGTGIPGGIVCDSLFGDEALVSIFEIDKQKTKLVPQDTYYPGNNVYVDLAYNVRNNQQFNQELVLSYIPQCGVATENSEPYYLPSTKGEVGRSVPYSTPLFNNQRYDVPTLSGSMIKKLVHIPQVSLAGQESHVALFNEISTSNLMSDFYLKITNKNGFAGQIVEPTSIMIGDTTLTSDSGFIPQNLNINQANNAENPYVIYKIDSSKIDTTNPPSSKKVQINFRESTSNIFVELGTIIGESSGELQFNQFATGITGSAIDPLKTGSCQIKMRILPRDQASQLTIENFDTYNIGNGADNEGNIISNVNSGDAVATYTIGIRKKPTSTSEQKGFFALNSPREGNSIPVNPDGDKLIIPLNYIYQSIFSQEIKNLNPKLKVSLLAGRYGNLGGPTEIDLSEGLAGSKRDLEYSLTPKLKEYLQKQKEITTVSSWISGGSSTITLTFEYEFIEDKPTNPASKNSAGRKSVKLYLVPNNVFENTINTGDSNEDSTSNSDFNNNIN